MPRQATSRKAANAPGGVEVKPARRPSAPRASTSRPFAPRHEPTSEDRLREFFGAALAAVTDAPGRAVRRLTRRKDRGLRVWRFVIGAVMLLAGGFTALALLALALAGSQPGWWVETGVAPNDAPRLAEEVERGVGNALHRKRDAGEPWTVAITQDEANAWIVDRLPRWLANQGVRNAEKLPEVRVAFIEDEILVGFKPRAQERTATLTITPRVEDAELWTPATGLRIGRMPLPASVIRERGLDYVPEPYRSDDGAILAAATLSGELPAPSTVELADGRLVRIEGVKVEDGRLLLTCVTVRE